MSSHELTVVRSSGGLSVEQLGELRQRRLRLARGDVDGRVDDRQAERLRRLHRGDGVLDAADRGPSTGPSRAARLVVDEHEGCVLRRDEMVRERVADRLAGHQGSVCSELSEVGPDRVDRPSDPLGDHDRRGVQRHRWNDRHDRRIDDAQSVDPPDGAVRVHDGPRVVGTAHRRRRGRVAVGRQVRGDHVCELVVPDCVAGHDLELDEPGERRIAADPAGQPHAFEHPARVACPRRGSCSRSRAARAGRGCAAAGFRASRA